MKKIVGVAILAALLLFLIPMGLRQDRQVQEETPVPTQLPDSGHTLNILTDSGVEAMDLNQYLWGVVAAEMPASFEQEALRAQAVAARTYALHKAGGAVNHPEADLCTNYACCQAWISQESARNNWGENADAYAQKITQAVASTNGEVILYDGALISAVFHSSSGAGTQDAVEVWGNDVPYLHSVTSPEGEEVPNYRSEVTMTPQEFKDTFLKAKPEAVFEGEDPAATAARELEEETGYTAASLTKLTELLPTPAYCTERIYLYQAHGLTKGEQRLDRDEFLDVVALPLAEALEMVLAGKVPDAKTQAGILLLARQQGI